MVSAHVNNTNFFWIRIQFISWKHNTKPALIYDVIELIYNMLAIDNLKETKYGSLSNFSWDDESSYVNKLNMNYRER